MKRAPVALRPRNREERALSAAVTAFAECMRQKLLQKARYGHRGWDTCDPKKLAELFAEHLRKGDPVDLANFLMMLDYQKHGLKIETVITAPRGGKSKWSGRWVYDGDRE